MNQTLYFAFPDVESAERIVRELLSASIASPNIRCVAKRGYPLDELPESNVLQKATLVSIAGAGFAYGALLGGIVGGFLILFPPPATPLDLWTMPIAATVGAAIGACISIAAGQCAPNSKIAAFEREVVEGNILLMVDVPFARAIEIGSMVLSRQAELHYQSPDDTLEVSRI